MLVPGSGWLLKQVVTSCRDPVGQLFAQARADRWGLLGRARAAASFNTKVGCAS